MITTRSGRQVKKPERYEPVEVPIDDFSDGDVSDDFSDEDIEESDFDSESESESDDDDADEHGNLKGFVVSDDEEYD